MARIVTVLALAASFVCCAGAQTTQYVYFSTRFAETPASGRGGNIVDLAPLTNPLVMGFGFVNEAAVANSNGLAMVRPGFPNKIPISLQGCSNPPFCPPPAAAVVDFEEIANIAQFNLENGDTNGNALYNDTTNGSPTGTPVNMGGIDCVWVPNPPANRAAGIHDVFISLFGDSAGAMSYRGTALTEADVFLLPQAPNFYPLPSTPTAPIFFIRQSHIEAFFGMTAGTGNTIDVDGFCVDQSNGDIYVTFDLLAPFTGTFKTGPSTSTTALINGGDIYRIPGTAYTPAGPYGVVTNPQPNLVERVYTGADVTAMVTTAGGCIVGVAFTNSWGLSIDSTAGTTTTPQGFTVKHLYFTIDNRGNPGTTCPGMPATNQTAAGIYSTTAGGSFAVLNGVTMNQPSAVGMKDYSFNPNFGTGPLDACCVVTLPAPFDPVAGGPFHLDNFPDGYYHLGGATPTPKITGYISGATPGATITILMRADFPVAGGYVDRYNPVTLGVLSPLGFPDIFIDVLGINNGAFLMGPLFLAPYGQNALAQSLFNGGPSMANWNPIVTFADPNTAPQADNGDSAFSMDFTPFIGQVPFPFVLTFQAVDMISFKLSDAISFEFN
jgi:hypothetical protein